MKIMSFLNNNSTLFFSWYCVLLCGAINYINFKGVRYTYLMYGHIQVANATEEKKTSFGVKKFKHFFGLLFIQSSSC